LPDYDFPVVGGTSEDRAELGVGPGDLPDWSVVAAEGLKETMVITVYFKDFDGFVGGAGSKTFTIVVQSAVMDHVIVKIR
jgi:hypothetical protein